MLSFGNYYLAMFHMPRRAFDALMADSQRLKFGTIAVLIPAFLYTLFYYMASAAGGAPSTFKPWLAIPVEHYFYWERYIVAPSMLLSWIVAAAVAQLLSRAFSGKGSFEDNLSVFGFGIGIASWSLLVHDLTDAFLGFIGVISMKKYELALNTPTIWRALLVPCVRLFCLVHAAFLQQDQSIPASPARASDICRCDILSRVPVRLPDLQSVDISSLP